MKFQNYTNKVLLSKKNNSPIILALDCATENDALHIINQISPYQCKIKIGQEMFIKYGSKFVINLQNLGFKIFLDLKFCDIPSVVAKAINIVADLGIWMVNIHALGGERMMTAARKVIDKFSYSAPLIIAVTILTSMNNNDLYNLGIKYSLSDYVLKLSRQAQQCGLDGVVCSAHEVRKIKTQQKTDDFILITPGIRLSKIYLDDQHRTMTPIEALEAGADYLVIGRPITETINPGNKIIKILQSLHLNH